VQRMVAVSVIGTNRFTGGYGAAKIAHEEIMLAGPVPARVLRAAQFHEFVEQLVAWGVPRGRSPTCRRCVRSPSLPGRSPRRWWTSPSSRRGPMGRSGRWQARGKSLVEIATLWATRRGLPVRIQGITNPADLDGTPTSRDSLDARTRL
jgi:hypothetical protein